MKRKMIFLRRGGIVPFENFFTHMETSPFPMKCCKFWHMLGTPGHGAVRVPLACHIYCDTGQPFIMVIISEDPWYSYLLPSVWQWSCQYLFSRLRSAAAGIRTPSLPFAGRKKGNRKTKSDSNSTFLLNRRYLTKSFAIFN